MKIECNVYVTVSSCYFLSAWPTKASFQNPSSLLHHWYQFCKHYPGTMYWNIHIWRLSLFLECTSWYTQKLTNSSSYFIAHNSVSKAPHEIQYISTGPLVLSSFSVFCFSVLTLSGHVTQTDVPGHLGSTESHIA